jgi:ribosome-associated protein
VINHAGTAMAGELHIVDGLVIPGRDLSWVAVRSSGPGGQNVNKVATKVILRFDLEASEALGPTVKARLRALERGRIDADGRLVVVSQATRNRVRNLHDARQRLAEMVRRALPEPPVRRATKPSRGVHKRRVADKRRRAEVKRGRERVDY